MPALKATGVCRPSELAHLVLRTNKPKPLIDFYTKFLNATVVHESELITFLTWDHEHHRIAILNDPNAVPKTDNTCGVDHFALTFDSLGDLLQSYRARKEMGIEPSHCINHGMTTSMYYRDPDGNRIETQVDRFDTKERSMQYMLNAEFGDDPRGPRFDPEDFLKRYEAGEDEATLMSREAWEANDAKAQVAS